MTNANDLSPQALQPTGTIHRHIGCERRGKKMLIEIGYGEQRHRCPVCRAEFVTNLDAQGLEISFQPPQHTL